MTPPEFLDHPGPIPFAHRGGAAESPENSWTAFEHAVSLGYRYMETDVRVTSDKVALAFHDPGLQRLAHRPGQLAQTSWDELRNVELDDGRPVPRLEDLLGTWPDLRWNIDVKTRDAIGPVVQALKRTASARRVLVASFSGSRSARVRRLAGPELATSAGRLPIAALVAAKRAPWLTRVLHPVPIVVQVPLARRGVPIVDEAFVRICHGVGTAVHIWTLDDEPAMTRLLDMGVDGIMTDRPTLLKQVLSARGQWA